MTISFFSGAHVGLRTRIVAFVVVLVSVMMLTGCSPSEENTRLSAVQSCPKISNVVGFKYDYKITLVNATSKNLKLSVPPIDCFDFSGTANPEQVNGATLKANSSLSFTVQARRVCAWIHGDIAPYFQERDAHWVTSFTEEGGSGINFTQDFTISCSNFDSVSMTMCSTGTLQDRDSIVIALAGNHALRMKTSCPYTKGTATATLTQIY
ncbi:hypothetical protein [uncultured Aurantimicrobium sp.]|uniref:hypothetical protein n=1 Tax=uncultured Aurantimicrobium sp. TaxID=1705357 RepID=UPI00261266C8|nr:hypothetical protein [uncultured Aurantimicrobium sp.]